MRFIIFFKRCLILIQIGIAGSLWAQTQSPADSINLARAMRDRGDIHQASEVLRRLAVHSHDFNVFWLYAETEYWQKHFTIALQLYQEAIRLAPDNAYLQLDYARKLGETRHYGDAEIIIRKLANFDVTRKAALTELARISVWKNRPREASLIVQKLLGEYPGDTELLQLQKDISTSSATWIKLGGSFLSDTQPLENLMPSLESGKTFSNYLTPFISVYMPVYSISGKSVNTLNATIGNKFLIPRRAVTLTLSAGVFRQTNFSPYYIGSVTLTKSFLRSITFNAGFEVKPYLSTVASLTTQVKTEHTFGNLNFGQPGKWNGKIAFDDNRFGDGNQVYSAYGYFLTPSIHAGSLHISLGYSFAFNNSTTDRFVSNESLPEILAQSSLQPIKGHYDPYFTPEQQKIHSGIANAEIFFSKKLKIGFSGNLALYATANVPYFYVQKNRGTSFTLVKDFTPYSYHPYEATFFMQAFPGQVTNIRAEYVYKSTLFYKSQYVGLSLYTKFYHR